MHGHVLGMPAVLYPLAGRDRAWSRSCSAAPRFGRRIYAIGNNARASFLAGMNVTATTVALYVLSGLFAALAGIMLVGYGGQATLGHGRSLPVPVDRRGRDRRRLILGGRGHYLGIGRRRDQPGRAGQRAAGREHARLWAEHRLRRDHPRPAAAPVRPRHRGELNSCRDGGPLQMGRSRRPSSATRCPAVPPACGRDATSRVRAPASPPPGRPAAGSSRVRGRTRRSAPRRHRAGFARTAASEVRTASSTPTSGRAASGTRRR